MSSHAFGGEHERMTHRDAGNGTSPHFCHFRTFFYHSCEGGNQILKSQALNPKQY